nr:hypothetical protein [uncultured Rhodopila sp.]
MDSRKLQDRLYFGLGKSARHIGQTANAFRPGGPFDPLKKENRFLRLPAVFVPVTESTKTTNVYGQPLWHGIFDASYTRTGDYLVCGSSIFFIASQEPLLPVLCVMANRTISVSRPTVQTATGTNPYGGFTPNKSSTLMNAWPASVLGEARSALTAANLPTDQAIPYWNIFVPAPAGVLLAPGDMVTDDIGRSAVIAGSELTNLGWRITAKMATT